MLPASSLLLRSALRTGLTSSSTQQWRRAYAGVVDLKSDEEFKKKLADYSDKNQLAIVDFTAKWCGPCKVIAPHFEQLSKQHPEVKFLKVDIDDPHLNQTVMDHGITGVPTFAVYRGAKRLESFTGARLDYLKECITKHGAASK